MLNIKDAKNIQTTSYVIALCVVANFVVIALSIILDQEIPNGTVLGQQLLLC